MLDARYWILDAGYSDCTPHPATRNSQLTPIRHPNIAINIHTCKFSLPTTASLAVSSCRGEAWRRRKSHFIRRRRVRLPTPQSRLSHSDFPLPNSHFGTPTSHFQIPTSAFRLPNSGFPLPDSHFNQSLSQSSTSTPLVDFGCRNAIFAPPAPILGFSSINRTPFSFNSCKAASTFATRKATC